MCPFQDVQATQLVATARTHKHDDEENNFHALLIKIVQDLLGSLPPNNVFPSTERPFQRGQFNRITYTRSDCSGISRVYSALFTS